MTGPALSALRAMQIGVLATVVLHLSKGMMRHGVTLVQSARSRDHRGRRAARLFYAGAIVLNHTNPIWIVWANLHAAPAYYTSMYGLGLIALLAYSAVVLHEAVPPARLAGAGAIVLGTIALGTVPIRLAVPMITALRRGTTLVVMGGTLALAISFLGARLLSDRRRAGGLAGASPLLESAFGVTAGLLSGFDPLLKAIGQTGVAGTTALPATPVAWIYFGASFLAALAAFLTTNWGYFRGCRAAVMIATSSAVYVTAPVVIQLVALPGYRIGTVGWVGLVLVNLGVFSITRPWRTPEAGHGSPQNGAR